MVLLRLQDESWEGYGEKMKNLMRYAGLRLMMALRERAYMIGIELDLDASQSLSIWDGMWCLERSAFNIETLYFDGASASVSRVHRWGSRVIVVEYAHDGGGTTYVLKADREVAPVDASAFVTSISERPQEAKENDNN